MASAGFQPHSGRKRTSAFTSDENMSSLCFLAHRVWSWELLRLEKLLRSLWCERMRGPVARTLNSTRVTVTWRPVYVWAGEVSRLEFGALTYHGIIRTGLDQTRTRGDRSIDGEKTLSLYALQLALLP
jgi:hypothetical protein